MLIVIEIRQTDIRKWERVFPMENMPVELRVDTDLRCRTVSGT